jgi:predicted transcriptional regulator
LRDYAKRSVDRGKRRAGGERIRPEMTITLESPFTMLEVLTRERIRLCQVARTGSFSVSALAAELKRDINAVRRDVNQLEKLGLIRTRLAKQPGHGTIRIVKPVAKKIELLAEF